MICDYNT